MSENAIEIRNLHFTYPGVEKETLTGFNTSITSGEIFGFLGPSGAGKSTTQKILLGILRNYKGSVSVLGKEISGIKQDFYGQVGAAFEFPNLYSKFTAMENLSYFVSLYDGPTEHPLELLSMVGLEEDAHTRVGSFSKGMRMRLNFCRALLNKPKLLFLDEPTSGLDPVNARIVRDIVRKKRSEGVTVFLTTHDMQVADDLCDNVAFMVEGRIVLTDSPRNLKLQYGERKIRVEHKDGMEIRTDDFPLSGLHRNSAFLGILSGDSVETIHTQEASLEDIFIKTTGRNLS